MCLQGPACIQGFPDRLIVPGGAFAPDNPGILAAMQVKWDQRMLRWVPNFLSRARCPRYPSRCCHTLIFCSTLACCCKYFGSSSRSPAAAADISRLLCSAINKSACRSADALVCVSASCRQKLEATTLLISACPHNHPCLCMQSYPWLSIQGARQQWQHHTEGWEWQAQMGTVGTHPCSTSSKAC